MSPARLEGQVIGQYRITGALGEGGMGVVYAAEHTLLGRPAAIKVLQPELSKKQEIVSRFFNEARAATAIRHPGIVEIYDFGWTPEGAAFIVMELLQGESLRARRGRAQLPWSTALALSRQIAGALAAAHGKGIVHRDLKPDNVFLVPDPEVPGGERIKLLDFGIAKLASMGPGQHMTRTGVVIGTPTYMAPEQCRGVAVDSRADLYSLGCILFELCAGRPPFVGEGEGDVIAAHIYVPPPTLASLNRGVPPELEDLVKRLLVKAPADRVQTAEEVIRLIDAVTAAVGVTTPHSGRAGTVTSGVIGDTGVEIAAPVPTTLTSAVNTQLLSSPRPPSRRALLLGGAAAVVSATIAIAVAVGSSGDVPSAPPTAPITASAPSGEAPPEPPRPPEPAAPPPSATVPRSPPPTEMSAPPAPPPEPPAPPSTVDVAIDSAPSGAKLLADGVVLGTTPYRGTLPRADRAILLVLQLGGHREQTLTVRPNAAIKQSVTLAPEPPTQPPPPPTVAKTTPPPPPPPAKTTPPPAKTTPPPAKPPAKTNPPKPPPKRPDGPVNPFD